MLVLLMGHRRGLSKALEKLDIPFVIWNSKTVLNKTKALKTIIAPYPAIAEDLKPIFKLDKIPNHVIAGSEDAVSPASTVRVLLDAKRNPHTVLIRCTDKLKMKKFLSSKLIPMTDFIAGKKDLDPAAVLDALGKPVIIKPRKSSGGRGIQKAKSKEDFDGALNNQMIYEQKIRGSEGSVESLIHQGEVVFTNITRYRKLGHCNLVPGLYSKKDTNLILALNELVIKSLNIQWGLSHLEFYKTKENFLFGEIALRPPGGYIMEAMQLAYDANIWEALVQNELGMQGSTPMQRKQFASSYIIYPNPGVIEAIEGIEAVKKLPSLKKLKIKASPGDTISQRQGVGQDCGYALFANPIKKDLLKDIKSFEKKLVFKMIHQQN